jgi:DNA-binding MarR family transcriptional regulator
MATQTTRARPASRRFSSVEQEVYVNLWRTYDQLKRLEDECFARFELTAQQYNVLRLLQAADPEPVPTLTLAGRLISRAPDITRMVDRLEARGLVQRKRNAGNRRVVLVAISPAGSALLDEIETPLRQCHAQQLGHLSAAELARLGDLLRRARAPHEAMDSVWK